MMLSIVSWNFDAPNRAADGDVEFWAGMERAAGPASRATVKMNKRRRIFVLWGQISLRKRGHSTFLSNGTQKS
jgi:hypothetical protein